MGGQVGGVGYSMYEVHEAISDSSMLEQLFHK